MYNGYTWTEEEMRQRRLEREAEYQRTRQLKEWHERAAERQMAVEVEQAEAWARMYAISDDTIRDALTLVDLQAEMEDADDLRDTQECARC